MTAFTLSPGLTPELTEAFLLELLLAIGVAHLLDRTRGLETAIALNAAALALVKLVTDWGDLPDVPVGIFGAIAGAVLLARTWGLGPVGRPARWGVRLLGALVLVLGAIKGLGDLFDPFDLMLGIVLAVVGLWLLVRPAWTPIPTPKARGTGP